jgi:type II secretory pathway pseudopilin PulG
MRCGTAGSSLVEILVALTILGIGLLGIAGASAMVSRMVGQGRASTVIMGYAHQRLELLRAAARDSVGCPVVSSGSAALPGGLSEQWRVTPGLHAISAEVVISGRSHPETLATVLSCQ